MPLTRRRGGLGCLRRRGPGISSVTDEHRRTRVAGRGENRRQHRHQLRGGSEPSFPDGDGTSETGLTEGGGGGFEGRDLAAESMFEYGSRVGFWRVARLLAERGMPATIFGCAIALERHPEAAAAIVQLGYDICCHGYRWERHQTLSLDRERGRIVDAIALSSAPAASASVAGTVAMVRVSTRGAYWSSKAALTMIPTPTTTNCLTGSKSLAAAIWSSLTV
jgi:NAD(P)-dependent dehydrogenase (short-subunit alcohol dehydrogenase family)